MKRASDVPPVVESFGRRPVFFSTALATSSVKASGLVRNASALQGSKASVNVTPHGLQPAPQLRRKRLRRPEIVEADIERALAPAAGMTLNAGLPTSTETISRFEASKCAVPLSSGAAIKAVEQPHELRDRIVGALGIGDMALAALDDERAIERAAPADLDHVAQSVAARRLADDAMIEALAFFISPAQQLFRAIDGRAFLVAGDKETDRALVRSVPRDISAGGGGKGGDAPLHVGGAAPPDRAIGQLGRERIEPPFRRVAHRHDIGMAGKDEKGRTRADARIEIVDVRRARFRKNDPLRRKAGLFQRRLEDAERAAVVRRHRAASDKRAAKVESGLLHAFGDFRADPPFIAWRHAVKVPYTELGREGSCQPICFKR